MNGDPHHASNKGSPIISFENPNDDSSVDLSTNGLELIKAGKFLQGNNNF